VLPLRSPQPQPVTSYVLLPIRYYLLLIPQLSLYPQP
jgi:hypothetical protein